MRGWASAVLVCVLAIAAGGCSIAVPAGSEEPPSETRIAPAPTATARPTPSPTLSPQAQAATAALSTYLDALHAGSAEVAWGLLSDWSKRSTGSFTTFADVESRNSRSRSSAIVGAPTQDPGALTSDAIGVARAADIAGSADGSAAFAIAVDWPASDGSPALSETYVVAPDQAGDLRIWLDVPAVGYGVWTYPDGCLAYGLSSRRCDAVVRTAAGYAQIDASAADRIFLLADPGCDPGQFNPKVILCKRSTGLAGLVRFEMPGRDPVEQGVSCGVGPPTLVCTDTPALWADGIQGYWDVPCTGVGPNNGCPRRIVPPKGAAAVGATPLRIASMDIRVGEIGHHEELIGSAVLPGGVLSKGEFSIPENTLQSGYLIDPGIVRMQVRPHDPSRPPFDNVYTRGIWSHPEPVDVYLVYDVVESSPDATFRITDVDVR
jgi:hypothetical protein